MIIDFHGHACGVYLTKEQIVSKMNENNISYIVLLPGEKNSKNEYKFNLPKSGEPLLFFNIIISIVTKITRASKNMEFGNSYVYEIARSSNNKIIQFYWVTKSNINGLQKDFQAMSFKGIKIHQCWDNLKVDSLEFKEIVNFAQTNNLPILIHPINKKQVVKIKQIISDGCKCKFIIAHLFGYEMFEKDWALFKNNIYYDISNAYWITQERLKNALNVIGSDNLIFGSDTPYGVRALEETLQLVNKLDIDNLNREKILYRNAAKLLEIHV